MNGISNILEDVFQFINQKHISEILLYYESVTLWQFKLEVLNFNLNVANYVANLKVSLRYCLVAGKLYAAEGDIHIV